MMQNYLRRLKPTTVNPKKKLSPKIGDTKLLSTNSLEGKRQCTKSFVISNLKYTGLTV